MINRLKEVREREGLTRVELAEIVGTRPEYLGEWELGVRRPRVDYALKLARALTSSVDYLFRLEEDD